MADDRPADSPVDELAKLARQFEDLKSTLLARVQRRPTGSIDAYLFPTPPPDTLLLQGQTVSRTTYAALWQVAQDRGAVIAGLFTVGDGSTTFGLPDLRGRSLVGTGTLGIDTYALGALTGSARQTLTTAMMPSHNHGVSVNSHGTHNHGVSVNDHSTHNHGFSTSGVGDHGHGTSGFTNSQGQHGGHFPGAQFNAPTGSALGLAAWNSAGSGSAAHNHTVVDPTFNAGGHSHSGTTSFDPVSGHTVNETTGGPTSHTVNETTVGGTTAVDTRPPALAVNYIIWT